MKSFKQSLIESLRRMERIGTSVDKSKRKTTEMMRNFKIVNRRWNLNPSNPPIEDYEALIKSRTELENKNKGLIDAYGRAIDKTSRRAEKLSNTPQEDLDRRERLGLIRSLGIHQEKLSNSVLANNQKRADFSAAMIKKLQRRIASIR